MANRKTQKKREREKLRKSNNFFDYKFGLYQNEIKMEGDDSNGGTETRARVSGGASIPSGESFGD